jgi:hypothetical protein
LSIAFASASCLQHFFRLFQPAREPSLAAALGDAGDVRPELLAFADAVAGEHFDSKASLPATASGP